MSSPWLTVIAQIQGGRMQSEALQRHNPRPPGQIVSGSTTDLVLQVLRAAPGFMTRAQIAWKVKRSRGAITWALVFLLGQGLIRCVPDASRNSRYFRYAATKENDRAS